LFSMYHNEQHREVGMDKNTGSVKKGRAKSQNMCNGGEDQEKGKENLKRK